MLLLHSFTRSLKMVTLLMLLISLSSLIAAMLASLMLSKLQLRWIVISSCLIVLSTSFTFLLMHSDCLHWLRHKSCRNYNCDGLLFHRAWLCSLHHLHFCLCILTVCTDSVIKVVEITIAMDRYFIVPDCALYIIYIFTYAFWLFALTPS